MVGCWESSYNAHVTAVDVVSCLTHQLHEPFAQGTGGKDPAAKKVRI